jgi:recombination protein U
MSYAGNRGKGLELIIEQACAYYIQHHIAVIQKVPTPIGRSLRRVQGLRANEFVAFYEKDSTVDFIGVMRGGVGVAFDAKETSDDKRFDLRIIVGRQTRKWQRNWYPNQHQMDFLEAWTAAGGRAFYLVGKSGNGKPLVFLWPYESFRRVLKEAEAGGHKSVTWEQMKQIALPVPWAPGVGCDFLAPLMQDGEGRWPGNKHQNDISSIMNAGGQLLKPS